MAKKGGTRVTIKLPKQDPLIAKGKYVFKLVEVTEIDRKSATTHRLEWKAKIVSKGPMKGKITPTQRVPLCNLGKWGFILRNFLKAMGIKLLQSATEADFDHSKFKGRLFVGEITHSEGDDTTFVNVRKMKPYKTEDDDDEEKEEKEEDTEEEDDEDEDEDDEDEDEEDEF